MLVQRGHEPASLGDLLLGVMDAPADGLPAFELVVHLAEVVPGGALLERASSPGRVGGVESSVQPVLKPSEVAIAVG
ncbi:hypothetical protein [Pseudonocardia sp. H11422]|uniref:hypothetical protein n=1 Tax=Pseudonocardia sp. H11422 TaxID=2835866 RepID=UPI001BDBEC5F|nr:hypothetical protein [Pseudonocardia sp. H11422]